MQKLIAKRQKGLALKVVKTKPCSQLFLCILTPILKRRPFQKPFARIHLEVDNAVWRSSCEKCDPGCYVHNLESYFVCNLPYWVPLTKDDCSDKPYSSSAFGNGLERIYKALSEYINAFPSPRLNMFFSNKVRTCMIQACCCY